MEMSGECNHTETLRHGEHVTAKDAQTNSWRLHQPGSLSRAGSEIPDIPIASNQLQIRSEFGLLSIGLANVLAKLFGDLSADSLGGRSDLVGVYR